MKSEQFFCDSCGRPLERHGERYVVQIGKVPVVRTADGVGPFDLCENCAKQLIDELSGFVSRDKGQGQNTDSNNMMKLIHDLYVAYWCEYPDNAEEFFEQKVKSFGIDVSDREW